MNSSYTRLPGVRRTPVSYDTLWMANDHLLVVHSNRISEQYQRIYFKDIQALVVEQPDHSWKKTVWGGFLALFTLALLALAFSNHYIIAFLMLLPMAIPFSILACMAQCRCYALTALGRYKLGALKRHEPLQSALAILTPLILEAQKKEVPTAAAGPSEVL